MAGEEEGEEGGESSGVLTDKREADSLVPAHLRYAKQSPMPPLKEPCIVPKSDVR